MTCCGQTFRARLWWPLLCVAGNHDQCVTPTGPTSRNCGTNCTKSHPTKSQRQRSRVLRTSRARIRRHVQHPCPQCIVMGRRKLFGQLRRHHSNETICCSAKESPTRLHVRNQRYAVQQRLVCCNWFWTKSGCPRGIPKILIPCSTAPASSPPLQTLARSTTNWARLSKKSHASGLVPARFHTFVFPACTCKRAPECIFEQCAHEHHVLPEGVFRRGRSTVLPAMRPFTWFDNRSWPDPCPQLVPMGPVNETFPQLHRSVAQFLKASSRVLLRCQLADHSGCDLWEPLVYHVQRVFP